MTELYHHQAIWNNRQFPKVYDVFFDLWGTEKLWTTIDRVNMNLPNQNGWDFGGFLHWDVELDQLLATRNIQGVLSLNDNDTGMGGLQIIPIFSSSWKVGWKNSRKDVQECWRKKLISK